jgi:anti-anti-sigma regulatory factor
MPATFGTIRYRRIGDTATFHVQGRGVMQLAVPLRQTTEQLIISGVSHVLIDLRDCTHMDSTFIGTLWTLQRVLEKQTSGRVTLLAPSGACVQNLREMGSWDGFEIRPEATALLLEEPGWEELKTEGVDPILFRRNAIEAHENLAALPGPEREKMQAVIRCLTQTEPKPPSE